MELRKLQAADLFSMVRILNGVGLQNIKNAINTDEIKEARKKAKENNDEADSDALFESVGYNVVVSVVMVVLERLPLVETDLYKFVGGIAGMKEKDVAKMDATEFMDLLIAIVQKEEFKDFFNRASQLIR